MTIKGSSSPLLRVALCASLVMIECGENADTVSAYRAGHNSDGPSAPNGVVR